MGVSKVNFGNQTLIDLTSDTVTAESLAEGVTAHGADGEPIRGTGTLGGDKFYSIEDTASNSIDNADYIPFYDTSGTQKTKILFSALKALIDTDTKDWASITGKPTTFPPSSHTHAWSEITGKPSSFTPASHTHAWSEITGKPSIIGTFATTPTSGQVVVTDGTTGGIKSSGYTIAKSVPADANFSNTWRGIQNNLTSDSTTDSLSAAQGKALKALIDGKTSNTGTVTSIATGAGLTGGTITGSGTLKANLKTFDPWTIEAKYNSDGNTNKLYAVGVDKNGNLAVSVPWTDTNTTYPIRFKYLDANYKTQIRTQTTGSSANSSFITAVRTTASGIDGAPQWGTGITAGVDDAQIYLFASHVQANGVFVGGGNADKLNYVDRVYTTGYKPSKSDVGLGNVANYDQSKAIKSITRSGTTFTYTCLDNTTGTFTQQDNNTWRGIQDNLTSDSTTDSLSAKQGKNLANGSARDSTKLPLAGGTLTGVVTSTYTSSTYVNSLTNTAFRVTPSSFGGWISGTTKNGNITIATYPGSDNKIYFGYGESGRTANSYAKQMTWDGSTGNLAVTSINGYTIGKSVPSDAVFTDTKDWASITGKPAWYTRFSSTWVYNIKIVAGLGSGQTIWIFTQEGYITAGTSGSAIAIGYCNMANAASWTYSKSGLTLTLNCTDHIKPFIISNTNDLTVTFTDKSTAQSTPLGNQWVSRSGSTMTGRLTTTKPIKPLITGTATAAQDKGSGVSPRYFPTKWTFNAGYDPTDGDCIIVKIPNGGHDYGVFVSTDNGSHYHPVCLIGTSRLTTHFASGTMLALCYDSAAVTNSVFAAAGADARTNITGSWRVINYRDTDVRPSAYCDTAAGTAAKGASCNGYIARAGTYVHVLIVNTNTYAGALTLNINGQGAKPIYLNGAATSSSNYNLMRGTYLVYYDGSKYYFRSDGLLQGYGFRRADNNKRLTPSNYLQITQPLSTSQVTTFTFTDGSINKDNSVFDIFTNIWGVNPSEVTVANGSLTLKFPKYTSAASLTVRVYVYYD